MRRTLTGLLLLAGLSAAASPAAAQYFGQNKVQYRRFDFQSIQTEHFDIYYYPDERTGALDYARARAAKESDAGPANLEALPPSPFKENLLELAAFAARRTY